MARGPQGGSHERAGDNPRFVVTSLHAPPPSMLYEDLYCARGTCENAIKAVKVDLRSDRTSATTFLANAMRLVLACAAYALHHALRTQTLHHTALAQAQPSTIILTLFKMRHRSNSIRTASSICRVPAQCKRLTSCHCLAVCGAPPGGEHVLSQEPAQVTGHLPQGHACDLGSFTRR